MEMLVFTIGILLCLVLSAVVTWYVVWRINKYHTVLIPLIMGVLAVTSSLLYNNVMQEYFIGKRVTYEQVCTEVSVIALYFK